MKYRVHRYHSIDRQNRTAFLRHNTPKKFLNLLLIEAQKRLRVSSKVLGHPYTLTMDTFSGCDLECPGCWTGLKLKDGRRTKVMSLELFRRVLDEIGEYLYVVNICNWGEQLLNRQLPEYISLASERNIATKFSSNMTSTTLSSEMAERLIRSGLENIAIDVDGATQETYATYRVGGNLDRVLANTKVLVETRARLGSKDPYITFKTLAFSHNEHELRQITELAQQYGVDDHTVEPAGMPIGLGWVRPESIKEMPGSSKPGCLWPWYTIAVHPDGGVSPCCVLYKKEDDFGNLGGQSLMDVWNSPIYRASREVFLRKPFKSSKKPLLNTPCSICLGCNMSIGGMSIENKQSAWAKMT